jgi:dipeptidyl-peptidase-4
MKTWRVYAALFGLGLAWPSPGAAREADATDTHPDTAIRADSQEPETEDRLNREKLLTIEAIFATPPITGQTPTAIRWMPDNRRISFLLVHGEGDDKQTHLMAARLPDGKRETLCILDTIRVPDDLRSGEKSTFSFASYDWSKKEELAAFRFKDDIFTLDAKTGNVVRRTKTKTEENNVTFAPDGGKIAFTRKNDLWTIDVASGKETRLTTTGNDSLLNGVLDWVYMEELFTRGDVQGYWWSPDSRSIAFLQINESPVRRFAIVDFADTYNTATVQHYPKAGFPNPLVRVGVYSLETGKTRFMKIDTADDSYIARLYWLGDSKHIALEKLNRAQNDVRLLFADIATGETREVLKETKPTWVNITYMKHYYGSADKFIWASDRGGNTHLYLFKNDGTLIHALTDGAWEITALDAVDEKRGHVYFTALEKSILERHLYRVGENGKGFRRVTREEGTHDVTFSPDYRSYIDVFSNASTPPATSVRNAEGDLLFTLFDSKEADIADYTIPAPEFFTIKSREGIEFQCSMLKPPHFQATEKYPVLVYVYGGPHSQVVRNQWGGARHLWHAFLAQRGYIVFSLDNRGSFGKGPAWENPILEKLGNVELADQMVGVEYLKSQPYVDASRIGIWGWSYGGYMTCLALFKAPGVFASGAAVAPVTDWRLYDTIYTERYMKRPEDNEEGYEDSAPLNFVDGLEAPFLLMHGTADDNVHLQNSMRLVEELIDEGKDFELMLYPGKFHGIGGDAARIHLYKQLTDFFERTLGPFRDSATRDPRYQ